MKAQVPSADLNDILEHTKDVWKELAGQSIFISGGTGFIGKWLLESFAYANAKLNLNLSVTVLSRNPEGFKKDFSVISNNPVFTFLQGDVRDFVFPENKFSYVIHAATEASAKLNTEQPEVMFDTILQGTRHMLSFAEKRQVKKFLFVSSGAIYGKQPYDIKNLSEDHIVDTPNYKPHSVYGTGKLAAEQLCTMPRETECKIARCFSFVGPYLPLDAHFAIGNFIRDGLKGQTIHVSSDGSAIRSYMYASDLVVWLLHILCFGEKNKAYNIGSEETVSIAQLADTVASQFSKPVAVKIEKSTRESVDPDIYVPSINYAKKQLGLTVKVKLPDAIKKTINWWQP